MRWDHVVLRSLLFAPSNEPRKLAKLGSVGSDAVVLDLEDAVAETEKDAARELVAAALATYSDGVVMVRVNAADSGRLTDDLAAVVTPDLDCVVVPKVEGRESLAKVAETITNLEREREISAGAVKLIASVESAAGLAACEELARTVPDRLVTLLFGNVDFAADLGLEPAPDGTELLYARSRIVTAARAAGRTRPLDGPYLELDDEPGLIEDTRRSRRLGFGGRVVIHPAQIGPVQRGYQELTPGAVERAHRIVAAFEAAEASGSAAIAVDGSFVDYPIYRLAKRLLEEQKPRPDG